MKSFTARAISLLVIFAFTLAGFAAAQTTRGTIAGVVTDATGAVVSGAAVSATPAAGGEARTTTTGPNGEYRIEALNPGEYTVSVEAQGFAKTQISKVTVRTSLISSNNVTLDVARGAETITVEASADQVQTESGELSKTIPSVQVKDIPYISLNPYSLATTLPGVTTVTNRDRNTNGTDFAVNGLRPRSNNFLIDGFDNNDNGIQGQAFQPNNIESVQEVTVLTNSYAPEFGRGGGSVSNLTFKSGGNDFHGALFEQYSGSALDAVASEVSGTTDRVPQYVSNVFGFRFGGPVVKNKLFFFGTSQWTRSYGAATSALTLTIPTAAGFSTLQSLAGTNQRAAELVSTLGDTRGVTNPITVDIGDQPGCFNCQIEFGDVIRTDSTASRAREWTARVDYTPTANDNLFVRYTDSRQTFSPDLFANPAALPSQDTQQGGPSRILGVMWAHTFSPQVLNEFRFSAQQLEFEFGPTAATRANPLSNLPSVFLSDLATFTIGSFTQGVFPQGRGHKTFQFQDALSWNRGTHNMKIGADLAVLLIRDQIPFNAVGTINITGGGDCTQAGTAATCTDLANYLSSLTGDSGNYSKNFGNPRVNAPTNQQAYYFQDSWKVLSNLTLDYGVRYEYQPPDASNVLLFPALSREAVSSGLNPLTRIEQKSDRNNFGPRFGFAYTPRFWQGIFGDNATVIRGGAGIFYDTFFTNISDNTAGTFPNTLGGQVFAEDDPASGTPGFRGVEAFNALQTLSATPDPLGGTTSVIPNLVQPQTYQWNLNVQRELPGRFLAEVAYVGTRGTRLFVNEQFNYRPTPGGNRLNPGRGSVLVRTNRGDSNYHGLQTSLSRNVGTLSLRGAYTYSRAIDNQSEVFTTTGGTNRWMIVTDPRSDRGVSAFHRTHRGSVAWVYQVPYFQNGLLKYILGGWASSGQLSLQSGVPETVFLGGRDQNGDGEANNDRPVLSNPNVAIDYGAGCAASGSVCSGVGSVSAAGVITDFRSGAVGTADQFRYLMYPTSSGVNGTIGRNSLYYPGRWDLNLSVIKRIPLPIVAEGHEVEFRADMFNAFNHPNLGVDNFSGNLRSANFFNIERTRFGGRTMALWLKYTF